MTLNGRLQQTSIEQEVGTDETYSYRSTVPMEFRRNWVRVVAGWIRLCLLFAFSGVSSPEPLAAARLLSETWPSYVKRKTTTDGRQVKSRSKGRRRRRRRRRNGGADWLTDGRDGREPVQPDKRSTHHCGPTRRDTHRWYRPPPPFFLPPVRRGAHRRPSSSRSRDRL